jgi:hypothetical protein
MFMPSTRVAWARQWPHGRFKFFCSRCKNIYVDAVSKPMKGIDRPQWADDEWRGSIMEHIRHARLDLAFAERDRHLSHQAQQLDVWRYLLRKFGKPTR